MSFEDDVALALEPPRITEDLPGIGGSIKNSSEDFVVREIPLYEPEGAGEHLYLTIRSKDRNTADLARDLARHFEVIPAAVGYAGRKDRQALTTQRFSVHLPGDTRDPERIQETVAGAINLEVLAAARHGNKLRLGHLAGNEFEIKIKGPFHPPDDQTFANRARTIISTLQERGLPNYFGPQRFGKDGDNIRRGRDVLKGRSRPRRDLADLFVSAFQSYLFNRWLGERIRAGRFATLLRGDIARIMPGGGLFAVSESSQESNRFKSGEITYTGPLFGAKMKSAEEGTEAGEKELQLLKNSGLRQRDLKRANGSRRPARLVCPPVDVENAAGDLWLRFTLPKGAFATSLLAEVMKNPYDSV